ncbi:olfactory receptor 9G19-like [Gastrophryne carolinensis]
MDVSNFTVTTFNLLGFYEFPRLQLIVFVGFLVMYMATLSGNILTIGLVCLDSHLHSPMYILLCNMSVLDISFTTMVLPKLLNICLSGNTIISYGGCISQVFFFVVLIVAEYFILAFMAYDRYVAICHPLRYLYFMSLHICICMILISWTVGLFEGVLFVVLISSFRFCRLNKIDHLFCDLKPLIELSCTSTLTVENTILGIGAVIGCVPSLVTFVSYIYIISTILKIETKNGRQKAFSTCSSHLTVIILFYGPVLGMYMRPKSGYSIHEDKILSVLYTAVIPMVNPLIYSLKNQEVKKAFFRLINRFPRRPFILHHK